MEARLAELERQQAGQFVEQQPEPRPAVMAADPTAAPTPLLRKLLERTSPTPPDYTPSGVTYNHRNRWFMKPDGDVVELPGSPQTIEMYLSMGFVLLTAAEEKQWLEHDRAIVLKDQRERARLINAVRAAAAIEPRLAYAVSDEAELDMQRMTTPELRARAKAVVGEDQKHFERPQRLIDAEDRAREQRDKRMMAGVDTAATVSMEDFERKMQRGNGRTIEPTPGQPLNFVP
jgi:hypothetical protein